MQITIDTTQPLSEEDRDVLSVLLGLGEPVQAPSKLVAEPKPVAKKAVAKPEPMAEEPVEEEVEEEVDADERSDEDLLALAVKKATEMVAGGDAAKVREALDAAGASRVRELNKDNVRDFFRALS